MDIDQASKRVLEVVDHQWVGVKRIASRYREKHGEELPGNVLRKSLVRLVSSEQLVQGSAWGPRRESAPIFRRKPKGEPRVTATVDEHGDVQAVPLTR